MKIGSRVFRVPIFVEHFHALKKRGGVEDRVAFLAIAGFAAISAYLLSRIESGLGILATIILPHWGVESGMIPRFTTYGPQIRAWRTLSVHAIHFAFLLNYMDSIYAQVFRNGAPQTLVKTIYPPEQRGVKQARQISILTRVHALISYVALRVYHVCLVTIAFTAGGRAYREVVAKRASHSWNVWAYQLPKEESPTSPVVIQPFSLPVWKIVGAIALANLFLAGATYFAASPSSKFVPFPESPVKASYPSLGACVRAQGEAKSLLDARQVFHCRNFKDYTGSSGELSESAIRKMALALHPDKGGDPKAAALLNVARNLLKQNIDEKDSAVAFCVRKEGMTGGIDWAQRVFACEKTSASKGINAIESLLSSVRTADGNLESGVRRAYNILCDSRGWGALN